MKLVKQWRQLRRGRSKTDQRETTMSSKPSILLDLPREIRDQIIGELFFPGEREPVTYEQDIYGLASTARRQINPFHSDRIKRPNFDVSVLRVCRQLQTEGEAILYGTSSFNLMYDDWTLHQPKLSYQFLEHLPKRLRRLVQRVERKCYSEPYEQSISLFEWDAFMRFLGDECPRLHTLKLWGPGDTNEGPPWVLTCVPEHPWVQALFRIRSLKYFDIPVIQGGNIYNYPEFRDNFLPWLRRSLTSESAHKSDELHIKIDGAFPFMRLPFELREAILRFAVLSVDRRIYVDMSAWYNKEMQTALSLMLTCKQLHNEVSALVCKEHTFYGDRPGLSQQPFSGSWRHSLVPRLQRYRHRDFSSRLGKVLAATRLPVKHIDILYYPLINMDLIDANTITKTMQLESMTVRFNRETIQIQVNLFGDFMAHMPTPVPRTRHRFRNLADLNKVPKDKWVIGDFQGVVHESFPQLLRVMARIPKVKFCYSHEPYEEITSLFAQWLTKGLREEWLRGHSEIPNIDWLYVDPKVGAAYDEKRLQRLDHP